MDAATAPRAALRSSALALIDDGATAADLASRFAAAGATVAPDLTADLLTDLSDLGLARVARGSGAARRYVPTSLGTLMLETGPTGRGAADLADLERLRSDLLATIAHELRTPLTAIRTGVGLLRDEHAQPTPEQTHALLASIERNAERMQRLISDVLDLARFRSGGIRLQLRRFDAGALAAAVVEGIAPLAAARDQRLDLRVSPVNAEGDRVLLFGDHARLERALVNLVSNAQKYAPDGSTIEVVVDRVGASIRWSVTDHGPGIDPADQAHLFERFFVGRNDRAASRDGVGLGLPMALAIAGAHGGTIEVRSSPGEGSTFTLVVPADGPED